MGRLTEFVVVRQCYTRLTKSEYVKRRLVDFFLDCVYRGKWFEDDGVNVQKNVRLSLGRIELPFLEPQSSVLTTRRQEPKK